MKALQKEDNIIFWIVCKALCWYSHLKEIHVPRLFVVEHTEILTDMRYIIQTVY